MFKDALKHALKEKNLTATALSIRTGIGKSSISQYISGKNEPGEKRKAIIATALDLPADYFEQSDACIVDIDSIDGRNLPVDVAANLMGKSRDFVYQGLRSGIFPWGYAVKLEKRWSYYISPIKFAESTGLSVKQSDG